VLFPPAVAPEVVDAVVLPLPPAPAETVVLLEELLAEPITAEEATNMQKRRLKELIAPMVKLRESPPFARFALLIHY